MRKIWNWKFAISAAVALIPALVFVIMPIELWGALTAPQEYRFGGEGAAAGMWSYQSRAHYVVSTAALWLTSALAIWALLCERSRWRWLGVAPFLLIWALVALDGTRLV